MVNLNICSLKFKLAQILITFYNSYNSRIANIENNYIYDNHNSRIGYVEGFLPDKIIAAIILFQILWFR